MHINKTYLEWFVAQNQFSNVPCGNVIGFDCEFNKISPASIKKTNLFSFFSGKKQVLFHITEALNSEFSIDW